MTLYLACVIVKIVRYLTMLRNAVFPLQCAENQELEQEQEQEQEQEEEQGYVR